ncbi:MAG: hypothetical protein ABI836_13450 [Gemmatimonadota bacterium]
MTQAQAQGRRSVLINRVRIPDDTLQLLEQTFNARVPDGHYWYDQMSGAWGMEGGPTRGFTLAGIPIGGPLPADISRGTTGVFINGRRLPPADLTALQQVVGSPVQPGRYWVDGQGYAGLEGGPPLVNLKQLASNLYRQNGGVGENYGNGGSAYMNMNTGIGIITDGSGGAAVFNH